MSINYTVIAATGNAEDRVWAQGPHPSYAQVRSLVDPILGEDVHLSRTTALRDGQMLQLVSDDEAALQGKPINTIATAWFRAALTLEAPGEDASNLPEIYGTAVLLPVNTCEHSIPLSSLYPAPGRIAYGKDYWPKGAWSIVQATPGFVVEHCGSTGEHRRIYRDGRVEPCTAPSETLSDSTGNVRLSVTPAVAQADEPADKMMAIITVSHSHRGHEVQLLGYGETEEAARVAAFSWVNHGRNDFDEAYAGGELIRISARLTRLIRASRDGGWEDVFSEAGEQVGCRATDLHHDLMRVTQHLSISDQGELCSPLFPTLPSKG